MCLGRQRIGTTSPLGTKFQSFVEMFSRAVFTEHLLCARHRAKCENKEASSVCDWGGASCQTRLAPPKASGKDRLLPPALSGHQSTPL